MQKEKPFIISFVQGLIGILILTISFYLLLKDETVSLGNYSAFQYAKSNLVEVQNKKINPDNEGELIHTTGRIEAPIIKDKEFGIKVEAIKLKRIVETYQWKEEKKIKTIKNKEGQKVSQFSYKYDKVWSPSIINSDTFYLNTTHKNPQKELYKNKLFLSNLVLLGDYIISSELLKEDIEFTKINISEYFRSLKRFGKILNTESQESDLEIYPKEFKIHEEFFYNGTDINNPQIGDIRISFESAKPFNISVIGMQEDKQIKKYDYGNKELFITKKGIMNSTDIFKTLEKHTYKSGIKVLILAFVLMFIGFFLIKYPFRKIILMIPFFGVYIAFSDKKRLFVIATLLTFITGGIIWSTYLPLESLLVAGISFSILVVLRNIDYKE